MTSVAPGRFIDDAHKDGVNGVALSDDGKTIFSSGVDQTIGHLGLSAKEEEQIVLFMKTLTDGYVP